MPAFLMHAYLISKFFNIIWARSCVIDQRTEINNSGPVQEQAFALSRTVRMRRILIRELLLYLDLLVIGL